MYLMRRLALGAEFLRRVQSWVKVFLTLLLLVLVFGTWYASTEDVRPYSQDPNISFDYGVKAALFAIAAATSLLIEQFFRGDDRQTALTRGWWNDVVVRILGVVSAFAAGGYWLAAETNGKPWPYLIPVFVLGGVVSAGMVVNLLLSAAARKDERRKE